VNDQAKDALVTVAGTGLALLSGTGAAVAAIPGVVGIAFIRLYERRTKKWWEAVINGSRSPEELTDHIAAGLMKDNEHVVAGIVGGARAAASAIELDAVLVIAELSRRFFEQKDLPMWFYRSALALLEQLEASELRALRRLLHEISTIRSDKIAVAGDIEGEVQPWRAHQFSVEQPSVALTPFPASSRLFGYIKRVGLGHDSNGVGYVGTPQHVVIEHDVAIWLRDAMPVDERPGDGPK
jgi:hypothetical protein